MSTRELAKLIEDLPADARALLERYAEELRAKTPARTKSDYTFNWAGGLRELRDHYSSVELQHKASEWRLES